jgi:hypothetical protein
VSATRTLQNGQRGASDGPRAAMPAGWERERRSASSARSRCVSLSARPAQSGRHGQSAGAMAAGAMAGSSGRGLQRRTACRRRTYRKPLSSGWSLLAGPTAGDAGHPVPQPRKHACGNDGRSAVDLRASRVAPNPTLSHRVFAGSHPCRTLRSAGRRAGMQPLGPACEAASG